MLLNYPYQCTECGDNIQEYDTSYWSFPSPEKRGYPFCTPKCRTIYQEKGNTMNELMPEIQGHQTLSIIRITPVVGSHGIPFRGDPLYVLVYCCNANDPAYINGFPYGVGFWFEGDDDFTYSKKLDKPGTFFASYPEALITAFEASGHVTPIAIVTEPEPDPDPEYETAKRFSDGL